MIRFVRPLRLHLISALSLVAFVIVAPSAHAAPTCFDRAATITGAGTINGTAGNDVIVGSDGSDLIDGRGGNDRICGLGGGDFLSGGRGDDQVDGGAGGDEVVGDVFAQSGDVVGGGNDRVFGGDGDDRITGDSATYDGDANGGGNDELFGGNGDDLMSGDSRAVFGGTPPAEEMTAWRVVTAMTVSPGIPGPHTMGRPPARVTTFSLVARHF
jgi:hypothetical protein